MTVQCAVIRGLYSSITDHTFKDMQHFRVKQKQTTKATETSTLLIVLWIFLSQPLRGMPNHLKAIKTS